MPVTLGRPRTARRDIRHTRRGRKRTVARAPCAYRPSPARILGNTSRAASRPKNTSMCV